MTALRIAHAVKRYRPSVGGAESLVEMLATRAAAAGCEVEVLTHAHEPGLAPVEVIDGVTVRRFPMIARAQHLDVSPALWRHLGASHDRYDLVHAHSFHASPAMGCAHRWHGPWVFSPYFHGTGHSRLRAGVHVAYGPLARAVFRRTDRVVCLTPAERTAIVAAYPMAADRTCLHPAPVEVDELRAGSPYEFSGRTIFTAGRLVDYKRVDRVIDALALTDPSWSLVIAGDGPARMDLEARAARRGVRDRVHFLGFVERSELVRWYRTASVFVTLSEQESQGMAAVEGLAAGAPVVLSDIPAHLDVAALTGGDVTFASPTTGAGRLAGMFTAHSRPTFAPAFLPDPDQASTAMLALYDEVVRERAGRGVTPAGASRS